MVTSGSVERVWRLGREAARVAARTLVSVKVPASMVTS
jgi:hypothetical protein